VGRRYEGTGFWGTNPHRNSLKGPTCVQGGKKNLTLHMGKHPLMRKARLHVGKDFHISTHRRLVSQWRAKNTPQVFKGPGPEKRMGLSVWEKHASQ
jgi:hypothetical protein